MDEQAPQKGLWPRVRAFVIPGLIVIGISGSCAVNVAKGVFSRTPSQPAASSGPSDTAQAVMDNQANIQEQLEVLQQQVYANNPDAIQQVTNERILSTVDARFGSFDDATYSAYDAIVREWASVIFLEAHQESQFSGKRMELILHQRLVDLKDRAYASATKHNGRVNFDDPRMHEAVLSQLTEQKAIAHIINQLINGQMPVPDTADISQNHLAVEGLSTALFEMQSQRISLTDAAPVQELVPSPVSREVPVDELATNQN